MLGARVVYEQSHVNLSKIQTSRNYLFRNFYEGISSANFAVPNKRRDRKNRLPYYIHIHVYNTHGCARAHTHIHERVYLAFIGRISGTSQALNFENLD